MLAYSCDFLAALGHFSVKPDDKNPRHLDVNIKMQFKGEVCDRDEDNTYKMH